MGGEARTIELGNAADVLTGFPFKSSLYTDSPAGIRLLRGDNVAQGRIRWDGVKRWPDSDIVTVSDYLLRPGDVILAMDRPWIEAGLKYAALAEADCPALLVQRVACLRAKSGIDQRFLAFVIGSRGFTDYILGVQTGTAVPHISASQIRSFRFPLLDLRQQQAIGELLGALDDKIELNRRMARTLEEMARALFRSWFVDFDPVRAKMEGRDLTLPSDIAALFPAQFGDGGLPEGWEPTPLSSLIEIISGGTPRTSEPLYWGGDIPWYSVIDAPPAGAVYVTRTGKSITPEGLSASPARLVDADTTIVSARGTVGKLALAAASMAFNQSCYGIRGAGLLPPRFTFCLMQDAVAGLEARSHGSVFSTITRSTFDAIEYPTFPAPVAKAFETTIDPVFDRLRSVALENETLAALRDTLLPRLISGKLHIPDAEALVEEAA